MDSRIKQALRQRLLFRTAFLKTVNTAADRTSPDIVSSLWSATLKLLPGIKAERELGKPVPESFSAKLQRKLASTVPPRPLVSVPFEDAYAHLERLCKDGLDLTEITDFHNSHNLMVCVYIYPISVSADMLLQTFVLLFQTRKPQPSVYIRTLLQHYLFGEMVVLGKLSIRHVLDSDLQSVTLPASRLLDATYDEVEVPTDPRHKISSLMESYRYRAAQSYLDIFRTLCQNRCRIRRTLAHTIADWDSLQLETEDLDVELRPLSGEKPMVSPGFGPLPIFAFPLSSWCYYYKLRQMMWFTQMGFELDVYAADERAGMYWTLHYLAQACTRHLQRISLFLTRDHAALRKDRRAENYRLRDAEYSSAISYVALATAQAAGTQALAQALCFLYTALARYALIPQTPHPYATDAIRYEQRMKPFLAISLPEPCPFDMFQRAVEMPHESAAGLLAWAARAVAQARKEFEGLGRLDAGTARCEGSWCEGAWRKDVKDEMKSCVAAGVAVATVKGAVEAAEKAGEKELKVKVECLPSEKGYHDWWAVPKVTPVK